jgi:mannose-6-phosphate isomerase-like protein (cupin superfamily)
VKHAGNDRNDNLVAAPLRDRTLAPTGAAFAIAEWTDDGGGFSPPRHIAPVHVHHNDDEAWYVLEGTLSFLLDGQEIEASAGSAVMVPRGVAHTWWNPAPEPARYLIFMTSRINELIGQIHAHTSTPDALRDLFRRYRSELIEGEA